jgi:tetratricopeptide (TPR) repeat protein
MDRFSRLEFGDVHPEQPKAPGEAIRDVQFFLAEAQKYWLAADFEIALRHYCRALEQNSTLFQGWSGQILMLIELAEYKEADVWADKAMDLFPDHPELLALKAVANKRNNRLPKAIGYSDNSIEKNDLTSRVWLARAEVFLSRKDAIVDGCLSKAVALAGTDKDVIKLEAARLLRQKRNFHRAMLFLNEVIVKLPKAPMAWYELGCCQGQLGLPQVTHSLEEALRLRPHWHLAKEALQRFGNRGFFGRLFKR